MESFVTELSSFFRWLVISSMQVSVLVCLILAIKALTHRRLAVRWHYWLWLLLLVRMVMPWAPESKFSVFTLVSQVKEQTAKVVSLSETADLTPEATQDVTPKETNSKPAKPVKTTPQQSLASANTGSLSLEVVDILSLVWLLVALGLAVFALVCNFRLWRIIKSQRPLTEGKILDLLEDCKAEMGVQTILGVVVTDKVASPALFGVVRPRLLLPKGILETLDTEELRYIFLHELAHLKRHDIYLGWLMVFLQVLHWFNPLVWLAFMRMRADRELACDGLVLSTMGDDKSQAYGQTLVNLFKGFSGLQYVPGIAGVLENKSQLKRRITMIARFKKGSYRWSILAIVLLAVLGSVALTNAKGTTQAENEKTAGKNSPRELGDPKVVSTYPEAFANDVDPELNKITVTFDQPMMNLSWSWVGGGETFPKTIGKPRYDRKKMTCSLPVKLEPGKFYGIGINSPQFKNFQTEMGTPAVPYVILFATKDKDGKPTAIPENFIEEAKEINSRSSVKKTVTVSVKTVELQTLIDSAKPGGTVIVPNGIYTEPIEITKPLTLKGQSRTNCIFEVTENKPAIFIDTKGKGKVNVEGITIKWQLATSDKTEQAFALGVKDSKAEIKDCYFAPLGNFKQSPVAVRVMGFSKTIINTCRFEGFDYVICYNDGTEGTVQNSLIMNCKSQGIILYSGAIVNISGNVITGSGKHAVRSTGGTLRMEDNLIINNANRGVYLGNKSARGIISNNVIMGNGTGISGFAQSKVTVENNIIADSSYAGIGFRDSCSFQIRNNIFKGNQRGWIMFKEGDGNNNDCQRNTFWENKVDADNFQKTGNSILADPGFVDPANGVFSLKPGPALEHKQGLTNPEVLKTLWIIWQNWEDKNEPFDNSGYSPSSKKASGDNMLASEDLVTEEKPSSVKKIKLSHDDGKNTGKWSFSGGGHAVRFKAPSEGCILKTVRIHGSRYGEYKAPDEDFDVWVCDNEFNVIENFQFPYSKFKKRGYIKWVNLKIEPLEVPQEFVICVAFDPHKTKGIYVYHDKKSTGNSFTGLPGSSMEAFKDGDWMIRAAVETSENEKTQAAIEDK